MLKLIKLIIWIAIITGGIFIWKYSDYENTILTREDTLVEITGWWFQSALIDAGADPLFTRIYLSQNTPDFELQKWKYTVRSNANIKTYIESLKNPINATDTPLTFLEWWNIFDIDQYLNEKWLIEVWEFISFAENHDLSEEYVFLEWVSSLEWYLYPDTYAINPNTFTVKSLSEKMLNNFQSKIIDSWIISEMRNKEIQDTIILASIVEKEERDPAQRPAVAGILKKRLDEWWMIGADITVCYPFRLTAEQCKLSVTKYLYEVNDYNTRQKTGLPAWPIWNPSVESIAAVVNPKNTDYYYYLHDTVTGKIYYGRDNAEHERNKQLYLR